MNTFPELIEGVSLELHAVTVELDDFKHELGLIEDALIAEICLAVNEAGKPLFPNETLRGVELRERLRGNETWQRLDQQRRKAEHRRATIQAKLERLRGEFALEKLKRREAVAAAEALA